MSANTPNQPFFNRLYVRIWLAVVFSVAVLIFLVGGAWRLSAEHEQAEINVTPAPREVVVRNAAGEVIGSAQTQGARLSGSGLEFNLQLKQALPVGEVINLQLPPRRRFNPQTGEFEAARPNFGQMRERRSHPPGMGGPPNLTDENRWFKPPFGFLWMLMLVGIAVALGTYPLIRRLTKRLNTLQRGVEQWGQGDLSTRVAVSGSDEVAFLAERFNIAASRIEALVDSHKSLLANASHELRSPLTRIRMGLELMDGAQSSVAIDRLKNEISCNINELDQLIAEILLASRLDSTQADVGVFEPVDLIGMAAEECAHTGAELEVQAGVEALSVPGVPKLLRRLMRNLLENANRYAKVDARLPVGLSLALSAAGPQQTATIRVTDHGPGVPEALRERIFEPFFRAPGASERDGGVGLGLALVKSIAQRHGGTVRCEAGPLGQGASFVVVLPMEG
jgi:two-component system OmpR family sensor kinase